MNAYVLLALMCLANDVRGEENVVHAKVVGSNVFFQIAWTSGVLICKYKQPKTFKYHKYTTPATYHGTYAQCAAWSKGYTDYSITLTLNGVTYTTNETAAIANGPISSCSDLWKAHVVKKGPITLGLHSNWRDFYTNNDVSSLLENTEEGKEYSLVLEVSSTCSKEIELGFSGKGGWFKVSVPKHAKNLQMTVIDTWENVPNTRFENRQTCGSQTITIHQVQLFEGSRNCLRSSAASECIDLWGLHVSKKAPVYVALYSNFRDFYVNNDLSELIKGLEPEVGEKFTMILEVSSTCTHDVEIGFSGQGGWFKKNVHANSKNAKLIITDTWRHVPDTRFENRNTCGSKSVTIHQIQLVKGSENCFN